MTRTRPGSRKHRPDGKRRASLAAGLALPLLRAAAIGAAPAAPAAHVTLDGTLGRPGPIQPIGGNYAVTPDLGQQRGGNLFHSFRQLDLTQGETATFSGPASVHNVLTRVTGGQASNVDGTIRCTIPDANFYLINPAGVVFGPDAALDVKGSFAVTTADVIHLADGGRFAAAAGPAGPSLTTAAPAAFGFLAVKPAGVTVQGSTLAPPPGKCISVVAGSLKITGGSVQSESGRVTVAAVASPGTVRFDPADPAATVTLEGFTARGPVEVKQSASINADGDAGGRVVIRAGS